MVTHNVMLAHAAAVSELRKIAPGALVSINFNSDWAEPLTDSAEDQVSSEKRGLCRQSWCRQCCWSMCRRCTAS